LIGRGYPKDEKAAAALADGLPFMQMAILNRTPFDRLVREHFATDRYGRPKGVVEVIL